MRALKPEEMELAAGGDGTTITVTGTRTERPPSYYEWWKLSGGEGSGGAGAGFGDGGEDTTTTNEYGSATFIGLREDGHILQTSPSSRSTAPRYIVIPELGQVFKTANFPGLTNNAFVLASCEK